MTRCHSPLTDVTGGVRPVTATISVGGRPYGIWADRLTGQIFVAGDGGVSVIDGQTNTVVHRIATGADPFWLALDPLTGTLYVTDEARLSVTAINVTTGQIVATIFLRFAPYGIAMDPKTDRAYVVVAANHLFTIDGRTNAITARRTVGHDAFGVASDAASGQMFVVNPNENTVTVVNGHSGRVAGSVPVGKAPFIGIAADPGRGVVYVTNDFGDSVSVMVRCQPSSG
jgi:DNA-binding beta-propeller fold protein YncE